MDTATDISGDTTPRFAGVRTAFEANFDKHGDVGAAVAVYVDGRKVVDLWGGLADRAAGRPWEEDTLALVFSTTKGVTAIATHLLAQRGDLDLDAPVADYWPEFAAEGKAAVPVRWLLSHRAGLPAFDELLAVDDALAWTPAVKALAAQRPLWQPGTGHGYHAITFGWLVGEVVRRATGRRLAEVVADDLAGPLGLDLWIGLPATKERRVARLLATPPPDRAAVAAMSADDIRRYEAFLNPRSVTSRALNVTRPALSFNSPAVHAAELPAANGIGTARSLAKLYAATIGDVDGHRLLDPATVAAATAEQSSGPDRVLLVDNRFGSGFALPSPFFPLMGPRSFGHGGAGGSLAFADPDTGVAFAYVMNQMQQHAAGDPRMAGLMEAVAAALR